MKYIYGNIDFDWEKGNVTMSLISPMKADDDNAIASSISSSSVPTWK